MICRADVRRGLPLRDRSIHCCVTSPPYLGLRDYGDPRQIGLEKSPAEYVGRMVKVFREVRRVLRDDGSLWLNIGDSYAGSWGNQGRKAERGEQRPINGPMLQPVTDGRYPASGSKTGTIPAGAGYKPKDLLGIPWLLAFALRDDGWYLRSEIIWHKNNPMPESVTDRPTKAHEQVFLLAKSARYFYDVDAIRETFADDRMGASGAMASKFSADCTMRRDGGVTSAPQSNGRNSRSVWAISTVPFRGAHFATMPVTLAERCIKAGTSERGVCPYCSAPHVRVTESERVATRPGVASKVYAVPPLDADSPYQAHNGDICGNRDPKRHVTKSRTTGWRPTCSCPPADPVPATVFDPFGGAMTTVLAARRLGRVGISTELSAEYAAIGRARLRGSIYDISGAGMSDDHPLFAERSLF